VLQLHWHRTPELFGRLLERHGFRVVSIARHPFDVLLSILQFVASQPSVDALGWPVEALGLEPGAAQARWREPAAAS
jgi:hypothetical protein